MTGLTRSIHSRQDPATLSCNLGIADAIQALFEFGAAIAAENQMGVTVDQTWGHNPATKIMPNLSDKLRAVSRSAKPDDQTIFDGQYAVFNGVIAPIMHGHKRRAGPQTVANYRAGGSGIGGIQCRDA